MSKKADYQKKYWWVILVAVPIVVALIGIIPPILSSLNKSTPSPLPPGIIITTNNIGNNMYFITQVGNTGSAADTQDAQQAVQRATGLVQNKNYADAIALLEQTAAQHPLPAVYNNLGVLYTNVEDLLKAQEAYQHALNLDPNDQAANYNLGLLKQAQGNTSDAASNFDKAPGLKNISSTQIPGVAAQLVDFSRFQNTITVKVRLINSTANALPQFYSPTIGSHLLDEATHTEYQVTDQSNQSVVVPANGSIEIWGKYDVSPNDKPQYLSVALGSGILFERIPVLK